MYKYLSVLLKIYSPLFIYLFIYLFIVRPYLGVKTLEMAVKVGLGMSLLAALIDVPHCAFSRRPLAGFVIDHLYNTLVYVIACLSFVYFK
jgi:hypothetical protein